MEIKEIAIEGDKAYLLTNEHLEVIITTLGAGIYSLKYYGEEMIMRPLNYRAYCTSDAYFGKSVGRIAGRVKNGELYFENKLYHVSINEGGNSLHGGKGAFSFRYFSDKIEGDKLILSIFSKDGDNGYPGNLEVNIVYALVGDALSIVYEASSDASTPVNLTNHSYFTLGESDCKNLSLRLAASKILTYEKDLSIKGEEKAPSCLDFRTEKKIGRDINDPYLYETNAQGYDHCFILDEKKEDEAPILLRGDKYRLEISTSFPSTVIYSSNYADSSIIGIDNKPLHTRSSLAIEPEYPPNDFAGMKVEKGVKKVDTITYSFFKER